MKREKNNKLLTVTLTIDGKRHEKLKETSRITRYSMSEITRLALDRLWSDIGDISKGFSAEALKILFPEQARVQTRPASGNGENM